MKFVANHTIVIGKGESAKTLQRGDELPRMQADELMRLQDLGAIRGVEGSAGVEAARAEAERQAAAHAAAERQAAARAEAERQAAADAEAERQAAARVEAEPQKAGKKG